jgi:hypothetical protein
LTRLGGVDASRVLLADVRALADVQPRVAVARDDQLTTNLI